MMTKVFTPKVLAAVAAGLVLAGCSSAPEASQQARETNPCRNVDPPTGSRLVRKSDCDNPNVTVGNQADVRSMQELQQQMQSQKGMLR